MQVNALAGVADQGIERSLLRLLIIEPDVVQGALIGELIQRSSPQSMTIHRAESVAAGVALLANQAFDAVWVSTPMPGYTLEATLDRIIRRAGGKPVIAMLEGADAEQSLAAHARGAADVYSKRAEIAVYFRKLLQRGAAANGQPPDQ